MSSPSKHDESADHSLTRHRTSSVDVESVHIFMRSLNESVPTDMLAVDAGRKITAQELRNCIRDMYITLGYDYSDRLGDLLVYEALHQYDTDHDGLISASELRILLAEYKKRPRRFTRHPKKCVVFGGGAFGTGMAMVLAGKGHNVTILMRKEEQAHIDSINTRHINTMCFKDNVLLDNITATDSPEAALEGVELIIHAVPVQFSLPYLQAIKALIPADVPVVSTSKGINVKTLGFMNDIFDEALGPNHPTAFISGPSFASGLVNVCLPRTGNGDPTACTLACKDPELGEKIRTILSSPVFRAYSSTDVEGTEVVGALKNVLSIGCGMCKGLGYGPNTQAVLVTRGWRDIFAMVKKKGGRMETMISLGGLGDLMMTCFGGESRNAAFGEYLAQGLGVDEAIKKVGQVVEGYPTAGAARRLAEQLGIETPVLNVMAEFCEGHIGAHDVISYLMSLPLKDEF